MRKGRSIVALLLLILTSTTCRKSSGPVEPPLPSDRVVSRTIELYYEADDLLLHPESRTLPLPENDAAAITPVVREFLKGSSNPARPRPFPVDADLRGAYLLPDGNAIVDLGGPTLTAGWSTGTHAEMVALYALVQTLAANFASVRQVRVLVNGQVAETLAGHIRLDRPLRPALHLLAKR